MEKRIGTALIEVNDPESVHRLNDILTLHAHIILGRHGLHRNNGNNIISLVLEGTTDEIGSLTGHLGRLKGIRVKSTLLKNKENE